MTAKTLKFAPIGLRGGRCNSITPRLDTAPPGKLEDVPLKPRCLSINATLDKVLNKWPHGDPSFLRVDSFSVFFFFDLYPFLGEIGPA